MVKKQTSARAEGGKTIFQFNLVQLGIWIIETLEWVWGTDSIEDKRSLAESGAVWRWYNEFTYSANL
eukprot:scaffold1874_cov89-Skeletonema_dohrnii-CCMP3373.AAC.6